MINIKKILIALILTCFIYPITINSELIEFNNKFFIPNDYNPFTGKVQDFFLKSNALKLEGSYLNGLKHGIFTHYFENGNVYKKENFLKGNLVGDLLEFNKDGNLIYKKSFKDELIIKNYNAILESLEKEKSNNTIKGDLIKSAFITSTMGVSYKLKLGKNI